MRTRHRFLYLTSVIWLLSSGTQCLALPSVTVMADSSMANVMAALARDYSREHRVVVNTSFASTLDQETQITEGSAADVLITPKPEWIEQLKMQGLVDVYSQTPIAKNRLALVAPAADSMVVNIAEKFPTVAIINKLEGEPGFVVGHPGTQAVGVAGKEALRNLGVAGDLEPYTLYIKQQGDMLRMIASGNAYGLLFYSTAAGRPGLRVLDMVPENAYTPVRYDAVVIAGDNMDEARKFLDYLESREARQLLTDNGFLVD